MRAILAGSVLLLVANCAHGDDLRKPESPRPEQASLSAVKELFDLGQVAPSSHHFDSPEGNHACIRSFPWPAGFDPDRDLPPLNPERMKEIRDRISSVALRWLARDPCLADDKVHNRSNEYRLLKQLDNGLDAEQVRLYSDYLYLATLYRYGRHKEVSLIASRLISENRVWIEARPIKPDEEHSYFSRSTLRNIISLINFAASAHIVNHDRKDGLSILAKYLDNRSILSHYTRLCGLDPMIELISSAAPEANDLLDLQPWALRRIVEEHAGVSGVGVTAGRKTVYLRGTIYHALSITPGGKMQLLAPETAAKRLIEDCVELTRRVSTGETRGFTLLPIRGQFVAVFSDGSVVLLDSTSVKGLLERNELPTNHAFLKSWGSTPGIRVFVPSPIGLDAAETNTRELLNAINRTFREHRVVLWISGINCGARLATSMKLQAASTATTIYVPVPSTAAGNRLDRFEQIQKLAIDGVSVLRPEKRARQSRPSGATEILILSASSIPSVELKDQVRFLGNLGQLDGSIVLFACPQSSVSQSLLSETIGLFGATSVFTFNSNVSEAKVARLVRLLREQLDLSTNGSAISAVSAAALLSGLGGSWNY